MDFQDNLIGNLENVFFFYSTKTVSRVSSVQYYFFKYLQAYKRASHLMKGVATENFCDHPLGNLNVKTSQKNCVR